ncbi:MAG: hypothetical protein NTX72_02590 [Candidatus Uhrbacteria bacterium]|nr:hypothetical protein [Candidatus Uhrbacteria bacterium]
MKSYLSFMGFGLTSFWIIAFLFAGCHIKGSATSSDSPSSSNDQIVEEAIIPIAPTETHAEKCEYPVIVVELPLTKEDDLASQVKRVKHMFLHPTCYAEDDRVFDTRNLLRATVAVMIDEHPNATPSALIAQAKEVFTLQPEMRFSKMALELIDLYHSIDTEKARTIVQASVRLFAIESSPDIVESIRLVKESLMREALVYTYRHSAESHPELDGVIGAYPFDHVKDRFQFAKDVVECFDKHDSRAIPVSFLSEVRLDVVQRKELLVYMLAPAAKVEDADYADVLDRRAETYVAAGYDAAQVNAATIDVFIEEDLFADAIQYANKHFDEAHVAHVEDRLMKIMRERGCYSIMEDADGHKMRTFDFKRGCDSLSNEEEDAESVE